MLKNRKFQKGMVFFLLITLVLAFCLAPVYGQDDGGDKEAKKKPQQSLWDVIKSGGSIGFFIMFLSVIGMALTIEHFITIRKDQLVPPELLTHIEALFEDEEYEEVMNICESQPNFLTNVIGAALPRIGTSYKQIEEAMAGAVDHETLKLLQKIGYIQLLSVQGPMWGLLGTVTGMIQAFQVIASSEGSPSPSELADSIGMALVTTAQGLFVAIPLIAAFFYFRNKVIRISTEVASICEELMERFRTAE